MHLALFDVTYDESIDGGGRVDQNTRAVSDIVGLYALVSDAASQEGGVEEEVCLGRMGLEHALGLLVALSNAPGEAGGSVGAHEATDLVGVHALSIVPQDAQTPADSRVEHV